MLGDWDWECARVPVPVCRLVIGWVVGLGFDRQTKLGCRVKAVSPSYSTQKARMCVSGPISGSGSGSSSACHFWTYFFGQLSDPSLSMASSPSFTQQIPVPVHLPSSDAGPPLLLRSMTMFPDSSTVPEPSHGLVSSPSWPEMVNAS